MRRWLSLALVVFLVAAGAGSALGAPGDRLVVVGVEGETICGDKFSCLYIDGSRVYTADSEELVKRMAPRGTPVRKATGRAGQVADLVFLGGNVLVADEAGTVAQALAVAKDRVVAVGRAVDVAGWIGPRTRVIHVEGKSVLPGLSDAHLHFLGLGLQFLQVDVTGLDKAATLAAVGEKAKTARPGEWVRGGRWNQVLWGTQEFPTAADLDAVAPNIPVVLTRVDGHAIWVNTAALKAAGITRDTADPPGGHIVRDARGEPTGILIDKAMDLVRAKMPDWTPAQKFEALELADRHLVSLGITSAHDAGTGEETVDLIKQAYAQGKLRLRLYVMLDKGAAEKRIAEGRRPEIGLYGGKLTVRAIKLLADGAMGSRGAAFFGDYSDQPGWKGLLMLQEDEIYGVAKGALGLGYQVCTHAIGDQANNVALNAYERACREAGLEQTPRFRIEHAQAIRLADIPRFAQLGVIASMQPCHATSDMNMAETRIGPFRILGAYAWRSLLTSGARIAGGTDAPVEPADPFNNLHAAVTRTNHDGLPTGGWYPEQKMTRLEALRCLTAEVAYAAFQEKDLGTLEVGKLADLVVISDDYLTCPEQELWRVRALMTVIGGQIVWRLGQ